MAQDPWKRCQWVCFHQTNEPEPWMRPQNCACLTCKSGHHLVDTLLVGLARNALPQLTTIMYNQKSTLFQIFSSTYELLCEQNVTPPVMHINMTEAMYCSRAGTVAPSGQLPHRVPPYMRYLAPVATPTYLQVTFALQSAPSLSLSVVQISSNLLCMRLWEASISLFSGVISTIGHLYLPAQRILSVAREIVPQPLSLSDSYTWGWCIETIRISLLSGIHQ